ncbi:sodium channel subunit beta-1-like isoform X3 [Myiozetetes cayanensis]|uniref:sodium channel subunit beta-1-like isoform X3 n=1 Tax=Myiozetetes cayanensis TaxID=478635 RepID=UPI00215F0CF0|nr:sodium channel subunit beta-1-like isoform X3 [Myiozetetes cayanensis]
MEVAGFPLLLGLLQVLGAQGGCVEVASGTEAVLGAPFRLLCIACKRRSETPAEAESEWFFRPEGAPTFQKILHYNPEEEQPWVAPGPFLGVLSWNGSKGTRDLQDLSVALSEVGHAHAGLYVCRLRRNLTFEGYTYSLARNQTLRLAVVDKARRDLASIVSEILMSRADCGRGFCHGWACPWLSGRVLSSFITSQFLFLQFLYGRVLY